jgi:hypothetical protein
VYSWDEGFGECDGTSRAQPDASFMFCSCPPFCTSRVKHRVTSTWLCVVHASTTVGARCGGAMCATARCADAAPRLLSNKVLPKFRTTAFNKPVRANYKCLQRGKVASASDRDEHVRKGNLAHREYRNTRSSDDSAGSAPVYPFPVMFDPDKAVPNRLEVSGTAIVPVGSVTASSSLSRSNVQYSYNRQN